MGVIFEENKDKGQAVIAGFVEGSVAEQRNKVTCMHTRLCMTMEKHEKGTNSVLKASTTEMWLASALRQYLLCQHRLCCNVQHVHCCIEWDTIASLTDYPVQRSSTATGIHHMMPKLNAELLKDLTCWCS